MCVNPYWVPLVAAELAGSPVKVCTVVGFPLGATSTEAKVAETAAALRAGAQEIDMVQNIGALRSGDHEAVKADIRPWSKLRTRRRHRQGDSRNRAARRQPESRSPARWPKLAGADFVKTSTGFGPSGATAHDVALMRAAVGPEMGVKASGGIRTLRGLEEHGGRRRHPHRRQRQRENRRDGRPDAGRSARRRVHRTLLMATAPRKSAVRFQERAELLDFLLEVSRRHFRDPGSRSHPGQRRRHRQRSGPLRPVRDPALQRSARAACASATPSAIAKRVVRSLMHPARRGHHRMAAATRQPILVGDVRNDPRYLTRLDAVRTELAVPMLARGKLVGVIDLQSTRLNAYREQDRALLQLIAARVAVAIDNARLYRRVDRQNRTLQDPLAFLAGVQLDSGSGRTAGQNRQDHPRSDRVRRLQHPAGGPEQKVLRHRFSERYDQRVNLDNIPLGKGLTGAAAESREIGARHRHADRPALHRFASRHPLRNRRAAGRAGSRGRRDGPGERDASAISPRITCALLALLAPQIASSVENARLYEEMAQREQRMEQDLKAARNLQSCLLPREAPEIEGMRGRHPARPAREITGDIYDIFEHGNEYACSPSATSAAKARPRRSTAPWSAGCCARWRPAAAAPPNCCNSLKTCCCEREVEARYVTLLVLFGSARTAASSWPTPAPSRP